MLGKYFRFLRYFAVLKEEIKCITIIILNQKYLEVL